MAESRHHLLLLSEFDRSPSRPTIELGAGLRGGISEAPTKSSIDHSFRDDWQFATTRLFERDVRHRKDIYPEILKAAIEICRDPLTARGNAVKPLSSDYAVPGAWRYRIGYYRLIYVPDPDKRKVNFHRIKHRSDVYSRQQFATFTVPSSTHRMPMACEWQPLSDHAAEASRDSNSAPSPHSIIHPADSASFSG